MNKIILSSSGATIFIDGKSNMVTADHPMFREIVDYAIENKWNSITKIMSLSGIISVALSESSDNRMRLEDGVVWYDDVRMPDDLSSYVIKTIDDSGDVTAISNFMAKLVKNPDKRVIDQLFGFLTYGDISIDTDGNFLAYKRVNSDFSSVHDRTVMNLPGTTISMPRQACDATPEHTCSTGLHFCSREYLKNFSGDKIVLLEVDPENVVSIPVDYNNTKGRACSYKIVRELEQIEVIKVEHENVYPSSVVEDSMVEDKDVSPVKQKVDFDRDMYLLGYKHGSKKLPNLYDQSHSYMLGYKHGKGKKKRVIT